MQLELVGALFLAVAYSAAKSTPFNASFDNLAADPLAAEAIPVPTPYDDLAYPGFNVRANGVAILRAHSPNNSASHVPTNGDAMITAKYTGSKVKYFDMDSSYLGCSVQSEVSVGAPEPCTVQFAGTKTNGEVVGEECTYDGTAVSPAMVECTFSTLKSVESVTVTVVESASLNLTVEALDNVIGVLYFS